MFDKISFFLSIGVMYVVYEIKLIFAVYEIKLIFVVYAIQLICVVYVIKLQLTIQSTHFIYGYMCCAYGKGPFRQ